MSEITITLNTTTKTGRASGIAVLLDTVELTLSEIGDNEAASIYAFVQFRGVTYAGCQFAAVDGDLTKAIGTMSLNTATLKAAFSNIHPDGVRCFPLTVINTASGNSTVCVCDFNIRNNPATPPSTADEIEETWLHTHGNLAILSEILDAGSGNIITAEERANLAALLTHGHTVSAISDFDDEVSNNTDVAANTDTRHGHVNFSLLETYEQTEANLADAVTKKHEHVNFSLLETYEQTEANLADAVSKKHEHTNSAPLDKITEDAVTGLPLYDGNSIGGTGNVRAPVELPSGNIPIFDDETGELLADSGFGKVAQVTITDDTTTSISLGLVATYRAFKLEYVLDDGTNYRKGVLDIIHDGTSATLAPGAYVDSGTITGISFDADIDSGNVRLLAIAASVGSNFKMVYRIVNVLPVSTS